MLLLSFLSFGGPVELTLCPLLEVAVLIKCSRTIILSIAELQSQLQKKSLGKGSFSVRKDETAYVPQVSAYSCVKMSYGWGAVLSSLDE